MTRETLKIIEKMDRKSLEVQFLLQCAPMIAKLKISNLLIISNENVKDMKRILEGTQISCICIGRTQKKTTMLIYHEQQLKEYLCNKEVVKLFRLMGYERTGFYEVLYSVKNRYGFYLNEKKNFPHELGLLLGYPVEDVRGYIKNKGRNYLCTGYWQVYADPKTKINLFKKFELAREFLLRSISNGNQLQNIIQ